MVAGKCKHSPPGSPNPVFVVIELTADLLWNMHQVRPVLSTFVKMYLQQCVPINRFVIDKTETTYWGPQQIFVLSPLSNVFELMYLNISIWDKNIFSH